MTLDEPRNGNGWSKWEKWVVAEIEHNAEETKELRHRFDDLIKFLLGSAVGAFVTLGVFIVTTR